MAQHSTRSLVRTLLDDNACRAAALRASPPLAVPHRVLDADLVGGSGTGTPVTAGSGSRDGTGGAFDSAYACGAQHAADMHSKLHSASKQGPATCMRSINSALFAGLFAKGQQPSICCAQRLGSEPQPVDNSMVGTSVTCNWPTLVYSRQHERRHAHCEMSPHRPGWRTDGGRALGGRRGAG